MRYSRFVILLLLLTACGDEFTPLPVTPDKFVRPSAWISSLGELLDTTIEYTHITADIAVHGVVTSCDSAGSIYKSLIIEDPTGAIELRAGLYDLYKFYRRGEVVTLSLGGLDLKVVNGAMSLGLQNGSIDSWALLNLKLNRQGYTAPLNPTPINIEQMTPKMVGNLIEFRNVEFTKAGLGQTYSGEQLLKGKISKQTIPIYTSQYASFANDTLPIGPLSVVGIVSMYKQKLQLRISSTDDVTKLHGFLD